MWDSQTWCAFCTWHFHLWRSCQEGKLWLKTLNFQAILAQVKNSPLSILAENYPNLSSEAVDFMQKMLNVDPNKRISAQESLLHPWIQKYRIGVEAPHLASSLYQLTKFSSSTKLKDAIYVYLATQVISTEEHRILKSDFQSIDKNGDGKLSRQELLDQYAKTMSIEDTKHAVENIMLEVDTDHSGEIEYI